MVRMTTGYRNALLAAVVVASAAVVVLLTVQAWKNGLRSESVGSVDPFPPFAAVTGMTVEMDGEAGQIPRFDVPRVYWDDIKTAMMPAKVEDDPSAPDWEMLGKLWLATEEHSQVEIWLFDIGEDDGAFTFRSGERYRGGSSSKLAEAIRRANEQTNLTDE